HFRARARNDFISAYCDRHWIPIADTFVAERLSASTAPSSCVPSGRMRWGLCFSGDMRAMLHGSPIQLRWWCAMSSRGTPRDLGVCTPRDPSEYLGMTALRETE